MEAVLPKPHKDRPIEGRMAKWYATNTGKSMAEFGELARKIAAELPRGAKVLEVAPGPGYFCIELAKLGTFSITGVDLSRDLVEIATGNAAQAGVQVDFKQGNASNLPLENNTFDFLLCRAAFKNFTQPVRALQEMHRVLRPGGRAVIIDLRRDASPECISRAVDSMNTGALNRLITRLTFRFMLLKRAYTTREFEEMVAQTEFAAGKIHEDGFGLEIWLDREEGSSER